MYLYVSISARYCRYFQVWQLQPNLQQFNLLLHAVLICCATVSRVLIPCSAHYSPSSILRRRIFQRDSSVLNWLDITRPLLFSAARRSSPPLPPISRERPHLSASSRDARRFSTWKEEETLEERRRRRRTVDSRTSSFPSVRPVRV